jgi:hypothetical protein
MEAKGKVNQYVSGKGGQHVHTLNLSAGTTPFVAMFDGQEYTSSFYRLTAAPAITIRWVWYRPRPEEFAKLDLCVQEHVLCGGLNSGELGKARPLEDDPADPKWSLEQWNAFAKKTYGQQAKALS